MAKKKIAALCAAMALAAVAVVGTVAYFTDTEEVTNTFTVGDLDIILDEAEVEYKAATTTNPTAGFYATDAANNRSEEGVDYTVEGDASYEGVFPGEYFYKDPTIHNNGDFSAYVMFRVTVAKDVLDAIGCDVATEDFDVFQSMFKGGLMGENTATQFSVSAESSNKIADGLADSNVLLAKPYADGDDMVFDFYYLNKLAAGEEVTLFTNFTIPSTLDNADFDDIRDADFDIDIEALAIQSDGFASAAAAFSALATQTATQYTQD